MGSTPRVVIMFQDRDGNTIRWARGWLESFSVRTEGRGFERRTMAGQVLSVAGPIDTSADVTLRGVEVYAGAPPVERAAIAEVTVPPLSPQAVRRIARPNEKL